MIFYTQMRCRHGFEVVGFLRRIIFFELKTFSIPILKNKIVFLTICRYFLILNLCPLKKNFFLRWSFVTTLFLQWTPSFIILLCKLIYSFIHIWTSPVISCYLVMFLILSDSCMECREHSTINHTWYNVSDFVIESVNYFNESFSRKWFKSATPVFPEITLF